MRPEDLRLRTKKFALDTIRFARIAVPRGPINDEIANQLTRASCSVAACYRAVCRARSRPDFIYKLGNAIEEVDEAALWLEILTEAQICSTSATAPLMQEADELTRILVASRETARQTAQN